MSKTEILVNEATESFKTELDAHPECRSDLCAEAALSGTSYLMRCSAWGGGYGWRDSGARKFEFHSF